MKLPFIAPLLTLGLLLWGILTLHAETLAQTTAEVATITLTTSRPIGQKISLMIKAEDDFTVEGVDGVPFDGSYIKYTLTSQTITIRGRITQLACWGNDLTAISLENCQDLTILTCSSNKLTTLDLSHCPKLSLLGCARNQIHGEAMKALAESLPDRSNTQPGLWQVHKSLDKIAEDGNIMSQERRSHCDATRVASRLLRDQRGLPWS